MKIKHFFIMFFGLSRETLNNTVCDTQRFISIASILCVLLLGCALPATSSEDRPKHHVDDGFQNYPVTPTPPSLGIGFYLRRVWSSFFLPDVPDNHYLSEEQAISQFQALKNKNTLTWIGQSTFLLRLEGKTILTDPFFSEYAGPYSMGPRRFVKPGISAKNLPLIDVIIISHNHYDHLDETLVEALPNKKDIHVFVPLKLKTFFIERGYVHVYELDWYESSSVYDLQITALPTVHYSGRGTSDKNRTLWCSWSIESLSGRYYFAGDTAYSPILFKDIGKKFNTFDLAMLSIGTYGNKRYGVDNHTTPEEAIKLGIDVGANIFAGMHWGTIEMSDEPPWEPPQRFEKAAQNAEISSERVWILKVGETRELPSGRTDKEPLSEN